VAAQPRPVTPVGIVAAALAAARTRLGELADPDPELVAHVERAEALAAGLDPYLERCSSPESPALAELAARTRDFDWEGREDGAVALEQEMLSGHLEGRFLALLVRATGARRVLEIGSFTGYSALAMAEALPDYGHLVACELDPEAAEIARESFDAVDAGARIELRVGPAAATIDDLVEVGDAFDLVFVDADKSGYAGYVDSVLGRGLLNPGGLICVDNTLLQGEPYLGEPRSPNGEAIAEFNERLREDPGVELVLVPLRDGITMIRRRDPGEVDG
jgi:caffeoyl-CoA O-methyltransferase